MPKTVRVAEVTELEPGEGKTVEVEGVSLALFNVDGTYFAIASACTHVAGRRRADRQRSNMPFARGAVRRDLWQSAQWPCPWRREELSG